MQKAVLLCEAKGNLMELSLCSFRECLMPWLGLRDEKQIRDEIHRFFFSDCLQFTFSVNGKTLSFAFKTKLMSNRSQQRERRRLSYVKSSSETSRSEKLTAIVLK